MSKIERIKAEIERRLSDCGYAMGLENSPITAKILYESYRSLLLFIDSLEDTEKDFGIKSSDLEEAAHSYVDTAIEWFDSEGNPCCYPAFIAGAQWQKERDQSTIELAEDHAYLAGQEKIIAKACEWLENYFKGVSSGTVYLEDFKKAIKE